MNRSNLTYCQAALNATQIDTFVGFTFTGKERDEETGYGYFGARYMDHELMTMWLSVDPMADKYPDLSPYNYCAWNPVVAIDPDGMDSVKIDLTSGVFSHIKSDGDHCIQYYRNNELVESSSINSSDCKIASFSHEFSDPDGNQKYITHYLVFSNPEIGESVFQMISELGSEKEWDFYLMQDNRGELSTSGITDKMIHNNNKYSSMEVVRWNHYHPKNSDESFYPSHSDQTHARKLGVPCFIHSQSKSMRFDNIIPQKGFISVTQFGKQWRTFAR